MLASMAAVFGQDDGQEQESRLVFQAGSKEFKKNSDGTFVNRFFKGVTTRHQDAVLAAEEGVYESGPGEIRFYGGATFEDSLRSLFADTLIYHEHTHEALAIGNVRVYEGDRSLLADRVFYQKDVRHIRADGTVTVHDDSSRATIHGMMAEFNDSTGYGLIAGEPFLEKIDDDGSVMTVTCGDTLELFENERLIRLWNNVVAIMDSMTLSCADTMEIDDIEKTVRLWRDVVALRDSLTGNAAFALYDDESERLTLTGDPTIRYAVVDTRDEADSELHTVSVVTGDTVHVSISDRKIIGAVIAGSATSTTSAVDSAGALFDRSIIESASMTLEMTDDHISRIIAGGTAQSYYHRNGTDDEKMFVNQASGDTLMFYFDAGKLAEMTIFGYGGGLGKGQYYDYEERDSTAVDVSVVPEERERGMRER